MTTGLKPSVDPAIGVILVQRAGTSQYRLISHLKKDSKIKIGKLGTVDFKKGHYYYVGSANGKSVNIENRTRRHERLAFEKTGNLNWHIDYFLVDPKVSLTDIKKMENGDECEISKIFEQSADRTLHGFGSSDCNNGCKGHLHYFRDASSIKTILEKNR